MRALMKAFVLGCLPMMALAACDDRKSDAATTPGSAPSSAYDTSEASNARYLADYAARPGVIKTDSGLMYRVLRAGTGPAVTSPRDHVTVYYKGALIDGKVFDQTKPEEPATFPSGMLIPGWVEALQKMKTGDTWELVIPAALGYGEEGAGDSIPPNQTLVFTMSLVKVEYAP